jgi:hypothetical protein
VVNFRYHLVSLGAVFLALAAGVVLGAGPLSKAVSQTVSVADGSDTAAKQQASVLKARIAYDDAYVASTAASAVTGTLTGTSVVLVVMPGTTPAEVSGVTARIKVAGATLTGQVTLNPSWADPAQSSVLADISDRLAPPEAATVAGTPYQHAAEAVASSITTRAPSLVGKVTDPATALLTGLSEGGFITLSGNPAAHAQIAVVLAPARTTTPAAYLPLALALDRKGAGAVVGGAYGSGSGSGFVAAIRADDAARASLATQDTADLVSGEVGVTLALAWQRTQGPVANGQFGAGPGATAAVPPHP